MGLHFNMGDSTITIHWQRFVLSLVHALKRRSITISPDLVSANMCCRYERFIKLCELEYLDGRSAVAATFNSIALFSKTRTSSIEHFCHTAYICLFGRKQTHRFTSMLNRQYLFVTCLVVLCLLRLQYKTMWTKIPNWSLFMSNKTHFAVQMNRWLFLFVRRCLSFDLQNRIYILQEKKKTKIYNQRSNLLVIRKTLNRSVLCALQKLLRYNTNRVYFSNFVCKMKWSPNQRWCCFRPRLCDSNGCSESQTNPFRI